jgi:hypothetical protein
LPDQKQALHVGEVYPPGYAWFKAWSTCRSITILTQSDSCISPVFHCMSSPKLRKFPNMFPFKDSRRLYTFHGIFPYFPILYHRIPHSYASFWWPRPSFPCRKTLLRPWLIAPLGKLRYSRYSYRNLPIQSWFAHHNGGFSTVQSLTFSALSGHLGNPNAWEALASLGA